MEQSIVEEGIFTTIEDYERLGSGNHGDEYDSLSSNRFRLLQGSGMRRLEEKGLEHETVAKCFVSGLGSIGRDAQVVAVHKNWSSDSGKVAREEAFRIFSDAVATKCGGDANIKFGWYGAPVDDICQIVSHGFSRFNHKDMRSESLHGVGVSLCAARFSIDCVSSSAVDQNGLQHALLCRVILGKVEAIPAGSKQFYPSSSAFDTGVDSLFAPRKYIVWDAFMNSHIQPTYVVSFKTPQPKGAQMNMKSVNMVKPRSAWVSFPTLMLTLSRFLDPRKMSLIHKWHEDFIRNKIPRPQLINKVRHIAGDELLIAVIKKQRRKEVMQVA
ncbi:probable inactive poly [ADP-ribose] polymerase SRO2 [Cucurbita moschata]|uniref:Probable inactive poly [ADP-ribose] polymerase SRO2 n=1 Tax=Cucurbita moschata TaxID=3662 RepID=A0A6J1GGW9_CUCMO|nr:probable inactive poly [ADP-ribose] polymerase SRO2 [Cucurbita moschata]